MTTPKLPWWEEKAEELRKQFRDSRIAEFPRLNPDGFENESIVWKFGALVMAKYFVERIEGTRVKDPASASVKDPEEMYNAGRESLRRELLSTESAGHEEKK